MANVAAKLAESYRRSGGRLGVRWPTFQFWIFEVIKKAWKDRRDRASERTIAQSGGKASAGDSNRRREKQETRSLRPRRSGALLNEMALRETGRGRQT
jgi:hypothetical protein